MQRATESCILAAVGRRVGQFADVRAHIRKPSALLRHTLGFDDHRSNRRG
jgi:hypothetical protein